MNIRYLEMMEAITETGTFTGAAKKLFMTQSAVSHAVAELEEQAGTALFERLPKGVKLTHCGRTFFEEARGILIASRNLDRRMKQLEEFTPVSIVSSITIASFLLPDILKALKSSVPELKVKIRVASANAALDALERGEADLAFWEGTAPRNGFQTASLGTYRLCAACSPDFSLTKQLITVEELCCNPLLLREQGSAIRDTFDHVLALSNRKAEPSWESVNSQALMKASEAGLGIVILPEIVLRDCLQQKRLRLIDLAGVEMENQMLALLHKDYYITKPVQLLLDAVKLAKN